MPRKDITIGAAIGGGADGVIHNLTINVILVKDGATEQLLRRALTGYTDNLTITADNDVVEVNCPLNFEGIDRL